MVLYRSQVFPGRVMVRKFCPGLCIFDTPLQRGRGRTGVRVEPRVTRLDETR